MNDLIEKIIWILTINFMLNACSSVAKDPPKPKNSRINKLDSLLTISEPEAKAIGKRIWINECGGTIEGLTSWNKGEYFASLGIGHFIWYHRIKRGPYEESFPSLVRYLVSKGVNVPEFILNKQCPWETRDDFVKARNSPQMIELRNLLLSTIPLQTEFILLRLENALPKMLSAISIKNRSTVQANFYKLTRTAKGKYALMDYINFKGEGTKISERYNGQGWGMLQALEEMNPNTETRNAPNEFAQAAEKVLIRRVRNCLLYTSPSPRDRG